MQELNHNTKGDSETESSYLNAASGLAVVVVGIWGGGAWRSGSRCLGKGVASAGYGRLEGRGRAA